MMKITRHVTRLHAGVFALAIVAGSPIRALAQTQDAGATPPAQGSSQATGDQMLNNGEVIRLDAFEVTTTIGAYHEETSAMATKVPTDLMNLTSSLQILNSNAISDRNAVSLQDIYSYVTGATQSQNNTNGFSFRGISNTGTFTQNIEYDGLQGGIFNHSALSSFDVADLEFLKGPNSVLYGQMRPGGLLNIVTKSPEAVAHTDYRFVFSTYAGRYNKFLSDNSRGFAIDSTGPIDAGRHWLYRVVADVENDMNFRRSGDSLLQLYPSLTYQWSPGTFLSAKVEFGEDRRDYDENLIPIFTGSTAYGSQARWETAPLDTRYQASTDVSRDRGAAFSTEFQKKWENGWTLRAQTRSVWHTDSVYDLSTNNASIFSPKVGYATPASTLQRQFNHNTNGHRYNFFDLNAYNTIGPDAFRNTVLVGVGGGKEFYNNQRWAFGPNVKPAALVIDPVFGPFVYPFDGTKPQSPRDTLNNLGEYASDQMKIGSRLHLTAGVRHDQQESHGNGDNFNPAKNPYINQFVEGWSEQLGAVVGLTNDVNAYASYSTSLLPNVLTSVDSTGHAGFAPEKGKQYEAGLRFETPDHDFYASAAAYWLERTNVLVSTGLTLPVTGQAIWRLDGAQHSEGVELESEYQPFSFWQLQVGAALGKAFIASSVKNPQTIGLDLTNAPRASGNFWSRYNVPGGPLKGFGAGLGVIYSGKQWGGDPSSTVYYPVPGYTRVDLAFYFAKSKHFDIRLNVQNLFDRKYYLSGQTQYIVIPGEARKFTLTVDTRF